MTAKEVKRKWKYDPKLAKWLVNFNAIDLVRRICQNLVDELD